MKPFPRLSLLPRRADWRTALFSACLFAIPMTVLATQNMVPPPPPAPAAPPPPPVPPVPPAPPPAGLAGFGAHHVSIRTHDGATEGLAMIDGDSVVLDGSDLDVAAVRRLQDGHGPLLWFRRDNRAWVIRDPAYLERAKAAYAEVEALGREQGKLGGEQGLLEIAEKHGKLKAIQSYLDGLKAWPPDAPATRPM